MVGAEGCGLGQDGVVGVRRAPLGPNRVSRGVSTDGERPL